MNGKPKESKSTISSIFYSTWLFLLLITLPVMIPLTFVLGPFLGIILKKDTKYVKRYFHYVGRGFQCIWESHKRGTFWRTFKINYVYPKGYIESRLKKRRGKCLRCGKCCQDLKCPLLEWDAKNKKWNCDIYDHAMWSTCGCSKFPLNQEDIDMYNCKGFWFEE
ncbi:hypothetical protein KY339_01500 [Candidatus Woesearchaeota archaeon]|nr:hypothetical protein [Candidatus Woesearchaeota archaeon]